MMQGNSRMLQIQLIDYKQDQQQRKLAFHSTSLPENVYGTIILEIAELNPDDSWKLQNASNRSSELAETYADSLYEAKEQRPHLKEEL